MKRKHGFTLIELLVVVAIIAVLVAMLLPTLAAARRQARRVICSGRLHSWGQILTMYADDNNGFYITRYDSNATDSWDRWPTHWWAAKRNLLRDRYHAAWPLWCCPEMETMLAPDWHNDEDGAYRIVAGYLYLPRHLEMARLLGGNGWPFNILRDLRRTGDTGEMGSTQSWCFSDHSPIPLMTDITFFGGLNWSATHKAGGSDPWGYSSEPPDVTHSVWPDGHVETRTFAKICNKNYSHGVCGQFTW